MDEQLQNIDTLENHLEADVLEAKRQLELGRDEALRELEIHRSKFGAAANHVAKAIERLADRAERPLDELQERLGQMNFLIAENAMKDLDTFERVRENLIDQIDQTLTELRSIEVDDGGAWERAGNELTVAWRQLRRRIELVRLHLSHDAGLASLEFDRERERLMNRLSELRLKRELDQRSGAVKVMDEVHDGYGRFVPWVKAFFMTKGYRRP